MVGDVGPSVDAACIGTHISGLCRIDLSAKVLVNIAYIERGEEEVTVYKNAGRAHLDLSVADSYPSPMRLFEKCLRSRCQSRSPFSTYIPRTSVTDRCRGSRRPRSSAPEFFAPNAGG